MQRFSLQATILTVLYSSQVWSGTVENGDARETPSNRELFKRIETVAQHAEQLKSVVAKLREFELVTLTNFYPVSENFELILNSLTKLKRVQQDAVTTLDTHITNNMDLIKHSATKHAERLNDFIALLEDTVLVLPLARQDNATQLRTYFGNIKQEYRDVMQELLNLVTEIEKQIIATQSEILDILQTAVDAGETAQVVLIEEFVGVLDDLYTTGQQEIDSILADVHKEYQGFVKQLGDYIDWIIDF